MDSVTEWPRLDEPGWIETRSTLHMWTQIVGKTRLALAQPQNHFWHVPLYVSARGLTTGQMPCDGEVLDIELDFIEHRLVARHSSGAMRSMPLQSQPLPSFFFKYQQLLSALLEEVPRLWPYSVEVEPRVSFEQETGHSTYDPKWATALWRALVRTQTLFDEFAGSYLGKCSPVQFYWGGFDLAVSRFSGRPAPPHPPVPNCPDWVTREAMSHEHWSAGFWPGNAQFPNPTFYAFAYPEPEGFPSVRVLPLSAGWDPSWKEFFLPYDVVRLGSDPDEQLRDFLHSTYLAAAELGRWDRPRLERQGAFARRQKAEEQHA